MTTASAERVATAQASATAQIAAAPERVYGIIADYENEHPHILPRPWFGALAVERGGVGAGTIIRFQMSVLGSTRVARSEISEPEPGRLVVERDLDGQFVTSFRVEPSAGGTLVTIATEWTPRVGVRGRVERLITALILRHIYARELVLLTERAERVPGESDEGEIVLPPPG